MSWSLTGPGAPACLPAAITSTTRLFGTETIDREVTIRATVGIYGGSLTVRGIILGDLVAVNADVFLAATAESRATCWWWAARWTKAGTPW